MRYFSLVSVTQHLRFCFVWQRNTIITVTQAMMGFPLCYLLMAVITIHFKTLFFRKCRPSVVRNLLCSSSSVIFIQIFGNIKWSRRLLKRQYLLHHSFHSGIPSRRSPLRLNFILYVLSLFAGILFIKIACMSILELIKK